MRGYRHKQANQLAVERRCSALKNIKLTAEVQHWIDTLIKKNLSPKQVSGYLEKHREVRLHHETIYQYIYRNKTHGEGLHTDLRIANKPYRKRYGKYDRRGQIVNRVSIDDKVRIGDWEGDTIIGKGHKGALLTLVDRKTLYTIIVPLKGKNAEQLKQAEIDILTPLKERVLTITFDNGKEFAEHEKIATAFEDDVYFAHLYASWERGINENINGLIRQYFPKGTDLKGMTQEQVQFVMDRLNNRPRKTQGGKTPYELFMGLQVDLLAA